MTALSYGNKSTADSKNNLDITASYVASLGTAIGLALLLRAPFNRYIRSMSRATMILGNSVCNTIAFSAAGFVSAAIMRENDLKKGINVYDEENKLRG